MENGENGFELFADVLLLMCGIESDRGHGGLLTNLTVIMCRRGHRNARWPGAASHRRDIKALEGERCRASRCGHLCRAYEREPQAASISYAAVRIFAATARNPG